MRVLRWLTGQHPSPRVGGEQTGQAIALRKQEVVAWLNEHQAEVTALAKRLRVESTRIVSMQDLPDIVVVPVGAQAA
jgi:hypothetical protein